MCLILGQGLFLSLCAFGYLKFILDPLEILIYFTKIKLSRRKALNGMILNIKNYLVDSDELLNKLI